MSEADPLAVQAAQFLASLDMDKNTDIGMRDYKGKVVIVLAKPEQYLVMIPQQAFNVAEQMARCAHKARFPDEAIPDDFNYLAQQVRQRLTEDMRDRLMLRIRAMLPSLLESKDLNYISAQLIDTVFAALDSHSYTALEPKGGIKYN